MGACADHASPTVLGSRATTRPARPRRIVAGVGAAVAVAVAAGVPTDVLPNPWFMRMTPAPWWTVPVWALTSLLAGVYVSAALARPPACRRRSRGVAGAGATAAWLAVGCPVCNKVVVAVLGAAGAVTWFAPVQPWLALSAPLLITIALARLRAGAPHAAVPPAGAPPHATPRSGEGPRPDYV
jgi:hypothetical protein